MKNIGFESKKFSCNMVLVGYDELVLGQTLRCLNKNAVPIYPYVDVH
jgi:hypothetical protein